MADTPQSGFSLGTAKATILMVADRFAAGAKVVQQASKAAGQSVDGLNASFMRAEKAAKAFDNSPLGKLSENLKKVRDQLALVSAAAAAVGAVGIKAAQDFATTRKSIELLTGSVQKTEKVFADVRKLTDKFNVPFDDAIKGAQSFLPIAKTTGVAVDELVKSAIRFRAYAPRKTFDEIKFSINEALSGDFVSIKDALDLSKKQRDDLKKTLETNGPQALLKGLNNILIERGFTDESLIALGESGANAFEQIRSEIKETMATAFGPLLKDFVLPTVKSIGEFLRNLRETNPDLLKFGAGVTAIVAAGAPLLTFLTTALTLFKGIKVATAALDFSKTAAQIGEAAGGASGLAGRARDAAGRFLPAAAAPVAAAEAGAAGAAGAGAAGKAGFSVVKGGLAVAGGVLVGAGAASFASNQLGIKSGDLGRISNTGDALNILGERLKQILVIVVDAFLSFAGLLAKGVVLIGNAIGQIVNAFKIGGTYITEIFANLQNTFGKVIQAIGDFVATLPGQGLAGAQISNSGLLGQQDAQSKIIQAQKDREMLMSELARGFAPRQEDLDRIDANLQSMKDSVVGGLIDMLFPMEQAVADAKPVFDNTTKAIRETANSLGDSEEYLEQQAKDIASSTQKYNDDLTALETKKQQDIIDLNKKYADEQIQIARDRVKAERAALEGLQEDLRKLDVDLTRDTEKEGRERGRKNIEMQIKFQRQEVEDAETHVATLERIRKDAQKKEEDAVENFDFAALFDLSEQVKEQTDAANEEYDNQRRERVQALQYERDDMVREFGAQREERLIQYENNRADRQLQYEQERAKIQADSLERQQLAAQAHVAELAQLQTKYTAELSLRQQAYTAELTLLMQTEQQRLAIMAQAQEALLQQAYGFMNRSRGGSSSGGGVSTRDYGGGTSQQRIADTQRQSRIEQDRRNDELSNQGRRTSGYALGGYPAVGLPSPVNESRGGFDAESIVRGLETFRLPNGLGLFTPLTQGTRVQPNPSQGGAPTLTVQVNLNGAVNTSIPLDEALPIIQKAAEDGAHTVLNKWMSGYER